MKLFALILSLSFISVSAAFAVNSPNGTIVRPTDPPGSSLTDSKGVWTFGTTHDAKGNYSILLNGAPAEGASGTLIEMDSQVKVQASDHSWWGYTSTIYWSATTAPAVAPPPPPPPPPSGTNTWIADNFARYPLHTGTCIGNQPIGYPSLVKDMVCQYGYETIQVFECDNPDTQCPGALYNDERIAFVNTTVKNAGANGQYGSGIITEGDSAGWNNKMDVFLLNVTISPYWPPFVDYATTNYDGITFNAGWSNSPGWPNVSGTTGGHVYAKDVTVACPVAAGSPKVTCWSDAALDVKPMTLMCVNCKIDGGGLNTLKLWWPGPDTAKGWTGHYIVNSQINNYRYATNPPVGSDGGLIWTWDCSKLVLNIYNSTFNGSPTLPRNMITCEVGGTPTINYLTSDPTQIVGAMHPMFR